MKPEFSVLIPDGESAFAYHVLTCLAQVEGLAVHILSKSDRAMCRYSRFVRSFHVLPPEKDYLEYIAHICVQTHIDFIMPVDMDAMLYFSNKREQSNNLAKLLLIEMSATLALVADKSLLADFLDNATLPHPQTITSREKFDQNKYNFPFPVLIKPCREGGGTGITKHTNREEVLHLVRLQDDFFQEFIIQEYMEGQDIDCSVLCENGHILAHTIQKSIIGHSNQYQPAEMIEFVQHEQVLDIATKLMVALHWNGVAHIDMRIRQTTSQVEIIEINPRFWGSIEGSLNAGVNFPYLACLASTGKTFPRPQYRSSKYMSLFSAGRRKLKMKSAVHLVRETNLTSCLKDPLPYFMKLAGCAS